MKKFKITWGITFLMLVITFFVVYILPNEVPMHYDMKGNIDRWGSKYELFIFAIMIFFFTIIWEIVIKVMIKRKDSRNNIVAIKTTAVVTTIFFSVLQCYFLLQAYNKITNQFTCDLFDFNSLTSILLGGVFVFLGKIVPKTKTNSLIGLRTKWSMKTDECWTVCNRIAGKIILLTGIGLILHSIWSRGCYNTLVSIGMIIVMFIIIMIWTYNICLKDEMNNGI